MTVRQGQGRLGPTGPWPWVIIGGSLLLSLLIYFGLLGSAWIDAVALWTADWMGALLNALGTPVRVDGPIVASDRFAVNIVAECTAVGPLVLFMGAVLAYPASFRAKTIGVALGLVVLTGVNLVRLVTLFWIGAAFPQYLGTAHLLVWQSVMILLALVLWLFWIERLARAGDR